MLEYNQIFPLDLQQIVVFYILIIFFLNIVYNFRRLYIFADSLPINNGDGDPAKEGIFSKIKKFIKNNYREILLVAGCFTVGGIFYWSLDISLVSVQKGYSLHKDCWVVLKQSREVLEIFNCLFYEDFTKVGSDLVIDGHVAEKLDKIQDLHESLNELLQKNPLEYICYLNSLAQNPSQSEFYLLEEFKRSVLVNWLDVKDGFENQGWTSITIDNVKMYYWPPVEATDYWDPTKTTD